MLRAEANVKRRDPQLIEQGKAYALKRKQQAIREKTQRDRAAKEAEPEQQKQQGKPGPARGRGRSRGLGRQR
jgi:hypothetical protein